MSNYLCYSASRAEASMEMTNISSSQDKKITKALKDGNKAKFKLIVDSGAPINADNIIYQICTKFSLEVRTVLT